MEPASREHTSLLYTYDSAWAEASNEIPAQDGATRVPSGEDTKRHRYATTFYIGFNPAQLSERRQRTAAVLGGCRSPSRAFEATPPASPPSGSTADAEPLTMSITLLEISGRRHSKLPGPKVLHPVIVIAWKSGRYNGSVVSVPPGYVDGPHIEAPNAACCCFGHKLELSEIPQARRTVDLDPRTDPRAQNGLNQCKRWDHTESGLQPSPIEPHASEMVTVPIPQHACCARTPILPHFLPAFRTICDSICSYYSQRQQQQYGVVRVHRGVATLYVHVKGMGRTYRRCVRDRSPEAVGSGHLAGRQPDTDARVSLLGQAAQAVPLGEHVADLERSVPCTA